VRENGRTLKWGTATVEKPNNPASFALTTDNVLRRAKEKTFRALAAAKGLGR
jgi:hypothetical protein